MYFEIGELKNATIKKEIKAVLELNHQYCPVAIRFEIKEKVVTSDGREIVREITSEHYSMYAIMTNTEKVVGEVKDIDLKTRETLNSIINILELLGIEGINVEEDP
ncbi:MAG: hypothetical protein QW607_05775 [Desulfurococcaceae archaeon]